MKAQVSIAIMARPSKQSHANETLLRPMNSKTAESTYKRQTRTKSTAGVRNALKTFFDWKKGEKLYQENILV